MKELFAWADNYDVQETRRIARTEGLAEGRAEGKAVGIAEGRAEGTVVGKAEGKREQALVIAKNLLKKNMAIEDIAEVTGLSKEEIEKEYEIK